MTDLTRWIAIALMSWVSYAPSRSEACDYAPISARLVSERVPTTGPIVVSIDCTLNDYCDDAKPTLRLVWDDLAVPGEQQIYRGEDRLFVVFRPDAPLQEGRGYVGLDDVPDVDLFTPVTTFADVRPAVADLSQVQFSFGTIGFGTGAEYCCGGGFACFPTCQAEREVVHGSIDVDLSPYEQAPFLLFRLLGMEADGSEIDSGYARAYQRPRATFGQPASEYCATLEVLDLATGEVGTRTECMPGEAAPRVGQTVLSSPSPDSFTFDCFAPPACSTTEADCGDTPAHILTAFCEGRQLACARESGCDGLLEYCVDVIDIPDPVLERARAEAGLEPEPSEPRASHSDDDPAAHDAGVSDPSAGGDEGADVAPPKHKVKACAVADLGGGRDSAPPGVWCFGLLGLARRLRRSDRAAPVASRHR